MNDDNFSITREGIKISYERFLSDSAGGYALALLFLIAFLVDAEIPFTSSTWRDLVPGTVSTEFFILFAGLTILLGTPLGLLMNAFSWFTLGPLQIRLTSSWLKPHKWVKWLTQSTIQAYNLKILQSYFELNGAKDKQNQTYSLYEQASIFEEILQLYFPAVWASLSHLQGVKQFTRNLALLSLLVSLYSLLTLNVLVWFLALVIAFIFVVFSSLLEFYLALGTLYKVYLVCYEIWNTQKRSNKADIDVIVNLLYDARPKVSPT